MRVAVLGSSGGMGGLFARYFLSRGLTVVGSDRRRSRISNPRFRFVRSNAKAVLGADVVVVATPIDATLATVRGVAGSLGAGTLVVEMMSVKGKVLGQLRGIVKGRGADLLSIHPLFGPSLRSPGMMRICVIRTDGRSLTMAGALFPDAELIELGAREHDRAMGAILSLTHLVNLAYAGTVIRYLEPGEFRRVQTPTSAVQMTLAESLLAQDPALYSYIQMENENSPRLVGAMVKELSALLGLVRAKDREGFQKYFLELSKRYSGDSRPALDLVYQSFEGSSRQR